MCKLSILHFSRSRFVLNWSDLPLELYRGLFHQLFTYIKILNYNVILYINKSDATKHSIGTNRRELTSTLNTYRHETNLQEDDLVIKLWPYDIIINACIIKMKRCHYMMMQTAQNWRNKKYFRCYILIYIYIYLFMYTVFLKWRLCDEVCL